MATKKNNAPVTTTQEHKEKADFLSFYDKKTREKLEPVFVITDPSGKAVCHLEFSMMMKWDKEKERAEWAYQNLVVKKPLVEGGEFEEVIRFVSGHKEKTNTPWTMIKKPEAEKPTQSKVTI